MMAPDWFNVTPSSSMVGSAFIGLRFAYSSLFCSPFKRFTAWYVYDKPFRASTIRTRYEHDDRQYEYRTISPDGAAASSSRARFGAVPSVAWKRY